MRCDKCGGCLVREAPIACFDNDAIVEIEMIRCLNCSMRLYEMTPEPAGSCVPDRIA